MYYRVAASITIQIGLLLLLQIICCLVIHSLIQHMQNGLLLHVGFLHNHISRSKCKVLESKFRKYSPKYNELQVPVRVIPGDIVFQMLIYKTVIIKIIFLYLIAWEVFILLTLSFNIPFSQMSLHMLWCDNNQHTYTII